MSSLYTQNLNFSPARVVSPHIRNNNSNNNNPDVDGQYLAELLGEHQKLEPFVQVVPICSRLLNQEILRVSGMLSNHGLSDYDRLQRGSPSPMASSDIMPNLGATGFGGWSGHLHEEIQWTTWDNNGLASSPRKPKCLYCEEGIAIGDSRRQLSQCPRGNSLKRVEASTGCRVFIRGKGSIKDADKEESLRGRPGYEHLNDPLHILIEAELPINIVDARLRRAREIIEELLKPVDESQDFYKRQQLRELAMLNSNFREESPRPSGSVSPFGSNGGMKRAKTGR
ncbi:unnamed protein product [Camellia sinensis]